MIHYSPSGRWPGGLLHTVVATVRPNGNGTLKTFSEFSVFCMRPLPPGRSRGTPRPYKIGMSMGQSLWPKNVRNNIILTLRCASVGRNVVLLRIH